MPKKKKTKAEADPLLNISFVIISLFLYFIIAARAGVSL
jgi:hypothetical protein